MRYLALSFSTYKETSPKLVYPSRDPQYSDVCKISTNCHEKWKGSESRQGNTYKQPLPGQIG